MSLLLSSLKKYLSRTFNFDRNPELTTVHRFVKEISQEVPAGARLLDCGAGESQYKARFSHTNYIAVDNAVGDAKWDYSRLNIICPLHQIPLKSGSIDVIICIQVMEHIYNPVEVLTEFSRLLRPGGSLYISAPFASGEHQIPHDYFRYTRYAWKYLLEQAGLEAHYIRPIHGYFFRLLCEMRVSGAYLGKSFLHLPFLVFQIFLHIYMRQLERRDFDRAYTGSFNCKASKPAIGVSQPVG